MSKKASRDSVASHCLSFRHLGWLLRNAMPEVLRHELYEVLCKAEHAAPSASVTKWKIIVGESVRDEKGRINHVQ